jgi:hypothetical protein
MCSSPTLYSGTSRFEISFRIPAIPNKCSNDITFMHNVKIGKMVENDIQEYLFSLEKGNCHSKCNFK